MRASKGFTLIELLIVAAILSFILATSYLAIAGFIKSISKSEVVNNDLVADFRLITQLDKSIKSMSDYYLVSADNKPVLLFYGDSSRITYISHYSVLGLPGSVLVDWTLDNSARHIGITLREMSLSNYHFANLPEALEIIYSASEMVERKEFELSEAQAPNFAFEYRLPFNLDPKRMELAGKKVNKFEYIFESGLPRAITLTWNGNAPGSELIFVPKVNNTAKAIRTQSQFYGLESL
ncbi:prepilin-type N-terminal cleavage/methylation domain-containing protein [Aliiglaciecola sp. CAU 1673]|uniref:PulJ/GspJ family protein n=1 Tax=Aliiglaciecola sp. CAU 1673 TaxID=3032595 RepID=UPI0023DCAB47|nr:prepilin-type N-terminal cleavage/methylation domain-containing protein [Aliiglaciecola sp. CAU 1673]MDF2177512.1 prepilin-type N-terminal cleavage/methylation domain-containing protein [Aliiglaciecola sp. CAU 1673]